MVNSFSLVIEQQACLPDEMSLVRAAQAGDLDKFNSIVLRYQDVAFRTAVRILAVEDLAEDAVQNAFISAFQHIHSFRDGSLKAWLMRIVVNKCYDQVRHARRFQTVSINEALDDDFEYSASYLLDTGDQTSSVEESVLRSEQRETIQSCLGNLSIDFRAIIVLADVEEMSYLEVSKILDIPVGTVKSRLARARVRLREELRSIDL
jgi:RNA polymerase sigma-70 factor (ECF subfamily)